MIDEERVREMTKMAIYEEGEGKHYIPMTQYFRHDYVGKEMVKSVITGTAAFLLLYAIWLLCNMEEFMEHINQIDLIQFGMDACVKYLVFLVIYLMVTFVVYNIRYTVGRRHIKQFYGHLKQVNKMYGQEEYKKQNDDDWD